MGEGERSEDGRRERHDTKSMEKITIPEEFAPKDILSTEYFVLLQISRDTFSLRPLLLLQDGVIT